MSIGERLRETRIKRHKTLEETAKAIHVAPTTISKYEAGHIRTIPPERINALADFFEVNPSYLMGFDDPTNYSAPVLNISEQLMLEEFRELSLRDQRLVSQLVHSMYVSETNKDEPLQLTL